MINCVGCRRRFNPNYLQEDWDLCPDCKHQFEKEDEREEEREDEEENENEEEEI